MLSIRPTESPRIGAGIGGVRAMQLIQKHGSLEAVMSQLDTARYGIPDPFPFTEARVLFKGKQFVGCLNQLNIVVLCKDFV